PVVEEARAFAAEPAQVGGGDGDLGREEELLVDTLPGNVLAPPRHVVAADLPRRDVSAAPVRLRIVDVRMAMGRVALRADRIERVHELPVLRTALVEPHGPEELVSPVEAVHLVHEVAFAEVRIEVDDHRASPMP